MLERLQLRRPSHGTVVAYLALFVALGGSAFAFHLGKNSVGAKQLRKNAVTSPKIKSDAVSGAKVADGSLTGADLANGTISGAKINLASLGTVPSAGQAASAHTLDGQSADQIAGAAKLRCPAGMRLYKSLCFEESEKGPVDWNSAATSCWQRNLRLPTLGELLTFEHGTLSSQPEGEWTEPETYTETTTWAWLGSAYEGGFSWGAAKANESFGYRCVTPASN